MRNEELQIVFAVALLLGISAAANLAWAQESSADADQSTPDAGADGSTNPAVPDAGTSDLSGLAPGDSHSAIVDAGLPYVENTLANSGVTLDTARSHDHSVFAEVRSEQRQDLPVMTTRAAAVSTNRLPLLGVMADVGVPDGLMGSLVVRPLKWVRAAGGGGTNSISRGWRTGVTLLPFGAGPSVSLEYGQYQDGDANGLAKTFLGKGFDGSPTLERVGYEFMNAHLGLDFGSRNVVFFIHGGVTMLRGQIHNLDAATRDAGATGTTEVVVRQDPHFKAVGPSVKLGLLVYVW
jgi:hypothetical protein